MAEPIQFGCGVRGQYVHWVVMAYPTLETLAQKAGKTPDDFTHDSFTKLLVRVHASRDAPLEETVCFREPHANGKPHFNLLVRASSQYRCKNVAETLLERAQCPRELRRERAHLGRRRCLRLRGRRTQRRRRFGPRLHAVAQSGLPHTSGADPAKALTLSYFTAKATSIPIPMNNHPPKVLQTYKKP